MIYNYLHDVLLQLQLRKLICAIMDGNNISSGRVRHAESSSALLRALTAVSKYDMLRDLAYQYRGDIIVFKTHGTDASGNHIIIVHRVAQIVTENGQRIIRAKGDANPDSIPGVDYPILQRNYIGKVVYVIPQLGAVLGAVNNSTNSGGGNTVQSRLVVIVPKIMQNLLKVISFFFVACFFVLGLRIQSAERTRIGSTSQSSSSTTTLSSL